MRIKFIIGEAGTAKTTTLLRIQQNSKLKNVAVAFTHSACNNMINKGVKNVKTLHSFFKILPNTTFVNIGHLPGMLLIDEFSMIPLNLILSIFNNVDRYDKQHNKDTLIVLAGDLLQLPPIETDDLINLKNLVITKDITCNLSDAKEIINTLARSIYSSEYYIKSDKLILTKNFRSEDKVIKELNNIIETGEINEMVKPEDLKDLKDYVFIASTYENLRKMRKLTTCDTSEGFRTRVGNLGNVKTCILTENINDKFFNGDVVNIVKTSDEFIEIEKNKETIKITKNEYNVFSLLPLNFLTVHYAQGRGFDYVCLCVDDLFEVGMLYTAITRAVKDIKFITFKDIETTKTEILKNIKQFKILKSLIY